MDMSVATGCPASSASLAHCTWRRCRERRPNLPIPGWLDFERIVVPAQGAQWFPSGGWTTRRRLQTFPRRHTRWRTGCGHAVHASLGAASSNATRAFAPCFVEDVKLDKLASGCRERVPVRIAGGRRRHWIALVESETQTTLRSADRSAASRLAAAWLTDGAC